MTRRLRNKLSSYFQILLLLLYNGYIDMYIMKGMLSLIIYISTYLACGNAYLIVKHWMQPS